MSDTASEPLDLEPKPSGDRRPFVVAGIVLLAVAVAAVVVAFISSREPTGYTAEDEQKFMAACTANGGEPVRGTCSCIYGQMATKVPYARFVAVNNDLAGRQSPIELPQDVEAIRADCVARSKPLASDPAFMTQPPDSGAAGASPGQN
ncbi:MAG: hypothetical protein HYX32_15450 [Actinobacteria bacterium]|nr:hypothetical protein [Actinomycetota bacterium]